MVHRGRKNIYELTMAPAQVARPDAPYYLTDAQADVWRAIVDSKPPEHFSPASSFLLTQLCRHKVMADRTAKQIQAFCRRKTLDLAEFAALLAQQRTETDSIVRMSRALRLTPQAQYRADSAKNRPIMTAPWDSRYDSKMDDDDD
jgi:hypothetical protein